MHDEDVLRSLKAEMLRDAAAEFRRLAAAGENPQMNLAGASMLEMRADRIAAGELDHSSVAFNRPEEPDAVDPPADGPPSHDSSSDDPRSDAH